jgi:MFS transporter, ACS family, glucarate transporter
MLAGLSLTSYVQRMNISVAATFMMPALSLTKIQMGQIFSSFVIGYALFQIPAGILGDRFGPRLVLSAAAFSWGATTLLTGLIPGIVLKSTFSIFASLLLLRFLLGVGESATYPVAARAIANWTPPSERAFSNAVVIAGLSFGSAVTPPIVSSLMVKIGWRGSFFATAALAVLMGFLWLALSADFPEQHPRITKSELALLAPARQLPKSNTESWLVSIANLNLAFLSLSYFFVSYVVYMFLFWFYIYLVEVRDFTILKGGIFASLPWVFAAVLTPLGGSACDFLATKLGRVRASRLVAVAAFISSACFLVFGVRTHGPYRAIASLALSVGCIESAEGAFWSTALEIGGKCAGSACGFLNMVGNLGGVVSTALVPVLIAHFGWMFALASGAVGAILGALIWSGIKSGPVELEST